MAKFYVGYSVPHSGETIIDADSIEEARRIASQNETKGEAEWEMLEDVSLAEITDLYEVNDDFEIYA
jgi:hypothetical protein